MNNLQTPTRCNYQKQKYFLAKYPRGEGGTHPAIGQIYSLLDD